METSVKVFIKNYGPDKKEYELGRQIILDLTRSHLIRKVLFCLQFYLELSLFPI